MSNRSVLRSAFIPVLLLSIGLDTAPCFGQAAGVAQMSGFIRDTSGAALVGARVRITQLERSLERNITSDNLGRYVAPELPVGSYQLEVAADGFKTFSQSGILLQVGNSVEINVTMQLGTATEHIEVTAAAEMAETKDNQISQVIDERRIVELPLNGRLATQFILLSGAATTAPAGKLISTKNIYSSTDISVAGGQGSSLNYLLDGGDNNDAFTNVNLPIPFPDALQEFSVETSSLPARFGLHSGGVVNAVTKSGTNDWHGDVFEFLRNGDVNARNFFAPVHDSLKRNQFGGTFGDHIVRDKLFFFGGFQGTFNRSNPPQTISFVPTPDVLNGNFSTIDGPGCISGGKGKTLTDPTTGMPFAGNQIPVSRFDKAAVALIKYLPAAQNACGKVTYGIVTTGDDDQGVLRMDWLQSSKNSIFGRYYVVNYRNPSVYTDNILTTTQAGNLEETNSVTLGDTYSFTPTLLNSAHLTFTRRANDRAPASTVPTPATIGVDMYTPVPNALFTSISGYFATGGGNSGAAFFNVNAFSFNDDIDFIKGKHQIAFGVSVIRDQLNARLIAYQDGTFSFNGQYATGKTVGDGLAAYMLGLMSSFEQSNQQQDATRQTIFGLFVQDSIRVTSRLTVNVGLRWDPALVPYDYFNAGESYSQANFNAGVHSSVFTNAPPGLLFYGDPGIPRGFQNGHLAQFSPRIGIAWDPTGSGKQTIRLSGAILRDNVETWYGSNLPSNAPFGTQIILSFPYQEGGVFSNPWAGYPGGSPFPTPNPVPKNYVFPTGANYAVLPLNMQQPYMAQWNVSYQRQITANWLASVTYLGNETTHVWSSTDANPAMYIPGSSANTNQRRLDSLINPANGAYYGLIALSDPGAHSNYNALLLSLQHRFSHGVTVLSNYTWSHCLSDADHMQQVGTTVEYENPLNRSLDYGNCGFDVRQQMNTSMVLTSPVKNGGWSGRILSGWQLAPLLSIHTGQPINILTGTDVSETGVGLDRPNLILPNQPYSTSSNPTVYLNPAAFQTQAVGTFGNLGRNALYAPGTIQLDLALSRAFHIGERWQLTPRFEAFNAINHPNFGAPNTTLSNSQFGIITTAGDPRILQFAMKLQF